MMFPEQPIPDHVPPELVSKDFPFIFGMTSLCIVYAGWDPNWFRAFLGVMLLLAVMVNLYVKKLSTARKVG